MSRLVVVGGDAAGMSAAHQAIRTAKASGRDLEVVALEATDHTSYSACGIPYWVAGDVGSGDDLVARTAEQHRAAGVDLLLRHRVEGIDLDRGVVVARDLDGRRDVEIGFDDVLLATGAEPVVPAWAERAVRPPTVHVLHTLDDGAAVRALLADAPTSALVVGGGYIGVEAAESLARRGLRTTLLTRGEHLMTASLVPALADLARAGLEREGVRVLIGLQVDGLERTADGRQFALAGGERIEADVVVVGTGVAPRTGLARDAGLPLGGDALRDALVPDDRQQVADGVWAAGDCAAVRDVVTGEHRFVPLGTHANRAGRVAGTNLGGGDARFPGAVGTAITRVGELEVGRTGLQPDEARAAGFEPVEVTLESTTISGYMPGAAPITVWVLGDRVSGRLLGCQVVGGRGAGKRVDVAATALHTRLTPGEVAMLDLAYAPPFSPVWDPVQIACRKLADRL